MTTPLHINVSDSIEDEFGVVLEGNFFEPGDLVQILWATNGVIYPPTINGNPHPDNNVLTHGLTAIGALSLPSEDQPGVFAHSISSNRPVNGNKIFVRVFNAPTLEDASFYGDSEMLTINDNAFLTADIGGTTNALDEGDDDSDGLINSLEKSLGSDSTLTDTDNDGHSDYQEYLAGTDPSDETDILTMGPTTPLPGQGLLLSWYSVDGKAYVIECATNALSGAITFENTGVEVVATGDYTEYLVTNGLDNARAFYRVKLAEE